MSTSAGWDGVLNGIIDEEDCTKDNHETGKKILDQVLLLKSSKT